MRYGILSDVHANDEALNAVFGYARKNHLRIDEWWFLGDALGYGPDPGPVLEALRRKVRRHWLVGNHDARVAGSVWRKLWDDASEGMEDHREEQCQSLRMEHLYLWEWCNATWTDAAATERRLGLRRLECWLVHGAIPERHPQGTQSDQNLKECLFEHVFPWIDDDGRNNSEIMLERLRERRQRQDLPTLLLHGHTHIPYARGIRKDETTSRLLPIYYDEPIRLDEYDRITICPGSVGQPRNPDRETHAAFGILDAKELTFQFCRVTYNTSPTRQKMNNLNYDLKLMQYLTGANQTHPFWNGNPLWHAWARCYRWREGKGWEPISDDQGVER